MITTTTLYSLLLFSFKAMAPKELAPLEANWKYLKTMSHQGTSKGAIFLNAGYPYYLLGGTIPYRSWPNNPDNESKKPGLTTGKAALPVHSNAFAGEALLTTANKSFMPLHLEQDVISNVIAAQLTRGPYLQVGNQTAVTLRWRTDIPTDSKIQVGTTYGVYTHSATDPVLTTKHEVRIKGLTPDSKYYYRFGSSTQVLQSGRSNYFRTAPRDNTIRKIRIAVLGDCGENENGNRSGSLSSYLNYTKTNPAELLLILGDNAYPGGSDGDYRREFFGPFGENILKNHILFPAIGNHEYKSIYPITARDRGGYYTNFSMPTAGECGGVASGTKAFYSFDWGNAHFISLDSYGREAADYTKLYDTLGVQVQWLKKDLQANRKKWVIVYWHHPPFSKGSHNSDVDEELKKLRGNFIRILERHGVDLVLTGHSHNYERSYLLNNYYGTEASFNLSIHAKSSSSAKYDGSFNSCPYITTSGKRNRGTVYVVAGSSGASGRVQYGYPHNALPFAVNDGGMFYLEIEANRLDGKMLRKDGTVFDKFTIMHDVNKTLTKNIAPGTPTKLSASWVGTYRWSTGATTRSIIVNPRTSTTYKVTDGKKCLTDVFKVNTGIVSGIAAISESIQSPMLELYPSPARRGAVIMVKSTSPETIEAYVSDIGGHILSTFQFTGTGEIDTRNLPSGVYILSLSEEGQLKRYKFVVVD
ncbi:metallophosphoesterase [Rufibacter latericius]|nr:metallophosphoesterase [Rufibacter latericius]